MNHNNHSIVNKVQPHMLEQEEHHHMKVGHHWMMMAFCIPLLAIAVLLTLTGVVGASFLFFAAICTLMMAVMMGSMMHGNSK